MYATKQVKARLVTELKKAALAALGIEENALPEIQLDVPRDKAHGDYATNLAMQLTRVAKQPPRQIAEAIVSRFDPAAAGVKRVEVAGPGFINLFLDNSYLADVVREVLAMGEAYGKADVGRGQKVQVEFVSANPTGSLHVGHARGAALGDALCNLLEMAGYDVTREYYINDAGNQIAKLAQSIEIRYRQALGEDVPMIADGYHGDDIVEFGRELAREHGDALLKLPDEERLAFFRRYGLEKEMAKIKRDLADFGVRFDVWYSETSLYESGKVEAILNELAERGHTYEKDGAVWFRSTAFGDDKDRVLVKSDGTYTYLTPDIAYHDDKFKRGFDKVINIWGADHHGYIPRMKAAMAALGYDPDRLVVLINQIVRLYQNGEEVRMSKRTGKAVTLRELMDEVGVDAMRYFLTARSPDTHLDFDLDLAVSQSNENPVYYVQYAQARICSVFRQAAEQGIALADPPAGLHRLTEEKEVDLMKKLAAFPEEIVAAAEALEPHRIVRYVYDLAALFHSYYNAERILTDDAELTQGRLALAKAVQTVLRNGLRLIGVSAPERM
ncbi:MAG: arginine--tRNA ligase [Calditerricola sp.]|nr:arginine--tRNA ligase [Calditerricola sp.]